MMDGTHDRLESLTKVCGFLETRSGLHVGAGKVSDPTAADLPVLRDALGDPYIPGSSLKGVLRSSLEALLRAIDERPDWWSCDPFEDPCLDERGDPGEACTVCRLFGSRAAAGGVLVRDLYLRREAGSRARPIGRRDGVGIDRDLRTAAERILYDFEAVRRGVRFDLEIVLENAGEVERGLLAGALDLLDSGVRGLGGKAARGLGRVAVCIESIETQFAKDLLSGTPAPPSVFEPPRPPHEAFQSDLETLRERISRG